MEEKIEKTEEKNPSSFWVYFLFFVLVGCLLYGFDYWRTQENIKKIELDKKIALEKENQIYTKICGDMNVSGFSLAKFTPLQKDTTFSLVCVFDNGLEPYVFCSDKNAIVPKGLKYTEKEMCTNKGYKVCYRLFNFEKNRWYFAGQSC